MFDVLFALSLFLCVLGGFEISLSPRFPFPALPDYIYLRCSSAPGCVCAQESASKEAASPGSHIFLTQSICSM